MSDTPSSLDQFIFGIATNLATELLLAGAGWMRRQAFGTQQEQELREAYRQAFAHMIRTVMDDDDEIELGHVAGLLEDFVKEPGIAEAILELAFAEKRDLEPLRARFDQQFDSTTIEFEALFEALSEGLEAVAIAKAREDGSSIFNQVVIRMLKEVRDTLRVMKRASSPVEAKALTSVFLSYARSDDGEDYDSPEKSLLRRLFQTLSAERLKVWWDRESLPSRGLSFNAEIEAAIRACDRFVLIAGPGAAESEYVQAELRCALQYCKPVTVLLRAGDYTLIPAEIEAVNAIDFRPPRDEAAAMRDLVNRLREDAPIGTPLNVRPVPSYYVERPGPFAAARDALCADALTPTVISAPPRAAAIFGYGGVGKSTLAAALAHDCTIRRLYPDGLAWIEIGQKPDMQARLTDIAEVLGDAREAYASLDLKSVQLRLSGLLHTRKALLILDDVWDADVVGQVPVQDTACRLLITTRSRRLAAKIDGADIQLDLLKPEEGAALIAGRIGGSIDDPVYRQLAAELGGHTLAIALAAAQVAEGYADSAKDMLELLQKQGANPLTHLTVDEDDKNESVERSLSFSYASLKPDLQRRFRALGIFARDSSFDRAALAAVWGDADADAGRGPLSQLLGAVLLEPSAEVSGPDHEETPRFRQHRLLHAYTRALLNDTGERDALARRHFDHFHALHADYDANNDENRHPAITPDFDNLLAALAWGWANEPERACDWVDALNYYLQFHQSYPARRSLNSAALEAARSIGYVWGEANTLKALGDLDRMEARYGEARANYAAALTAFRAIPDRLGEAHTLQALGELDRMEDRYGEARANYAAALTAFRAIPDRLGEAHTLQALGELDRMEARYGEARANYAAALTAFRAIPDRLGEAHTLQALGELDRMEARYGEARANYAAALTAYRAIPSRLGEANTLKALGDLDRMEARYGEARANYAAALTAFRAIPDRLGEAHTLQALGELDRMEARYGEARANYAAALTAFRAIPDRLGEAHTLQALGELDRMEDRYGEARANYAAALALAEQIPDRVGQLNTLHSLGLLEKAEGNLAAAKESYRRCLALADSIDAFRDHPVVAGWRREYEALLEPEDRPGGDGEG